MFDHLKRPLAAIVLAAAGAFSLAPAQAAAPARLDKITLAGPTAVVSFPLLHMVETQALSQYTDRLEFRLWQSPDQLRVLLAKKEIDLTATPSNLPALMSNRGMPVRLLNISVWGILWLVSSDPNVKGFGDLAGQELLVPFQRDLPSVLLDTLLKEKGLDGANGIRLRRTRDSQDAIALMLTGQGRHALLVEPVTSMLLWRNAQQGQAPLHRVISLEDAWRETFPGEAALPQAGIMANAHVADNTALGAAVVQAYAQSARWCKSEPGECAALVHKYLPQLPTPAVEQSIRMTRIDSRPAKEIRPELEALYSLLMRQHPDAVAGRLPDPGFYGP
jgi:NitT/TauT family transport system substrate-binding protein